MLRGYIVLFFLQNVLYGLQASTLMTYHYSQCQSNKGANEKESFSTAKIVCAYSLNVINIFWQHGTPAH